MIFNGVCVKWVGVLDLQRIDGVGQLQFDEAAARTFEGGIVKSEDASSSSSSSGGREFQQQQQHHGGVSVTASA